MTTLFNMTRDINGYNGFGLKPTDTAYSATLIASTDTALTVPIEFALGNCSSTAVARLLAIIVSDPGDAVWVALNATATVPAGAAFAPTLSALNPAAYEVKGGDVLHFITAGTGVDISIRFYWITS
jgi:hypothetical protein